MPPVSGDCTEQLLYGQPLALFQLGRLPEAKKALRRAMKTFPRIDEELLRDTHKRPPNIDEDKITFGVLTRRIFTGRRTGSFGRKRWARWSSCKPLEEVARRLRRRLASGRRSFEGGGQGR